MPTPQSQTDTITPGPDQTDAPRPMRTEAMSSPDSDPSQLVGTPSDSEVGALGSSAARPVLPGTTELLILPSQLEPGMRIFGDKYEVIEKLGEGGMGSVWLVRHQFLEDDHALKLIAHKIALDPDVKDRFKREARAMVKARHPNAVMVHDALIDQHLAYILMEYVPGSSLNQVLKPGKPMPLDWTVRLLSQLCDVLQVAHERGIVHRDLKPSNLMIIEGSRPDSFQLKVLDFGIAKIWEAEERPDDAQSIDGNFLGTPYYASPEQIRGEKVDHRSDLYTVGVILFELLTGKQPFTGKSSAVMINHINQLPPTFESINPNLHISQEVEAVVRRCLAKEPIDRPESAQELYQEFLQVLSPSQQIALGSPSTWSGAAIGSSDLVQPPPLPGRSGERSTPSTPTTLETAAQNGTLPDTKEGFKPTGWDWADETGDSKKTQRIFAPPGAAHSNSQAVVEPIPQHVLPPGPWRRAVGFGSLGLLALLIGWGAWNALDPSRLWANFDNLYSQTPALHVLEAEPKADGSTFLLLPEGYRAGEDSDLLKLASGFRIPRVLEPEGSGEPVVLLPEGQPEDSSAGFVELLDGLWLPERLLQEFAGQNFLLLPEKYRPEDSSTLNELAKGLLIPSVLVRETDNERFIWIEGGDFLQGADRLAPPQPGDDHFPPQPVGVSGFYMQDKEVSYAEIEAYCRAVLGNNLQDPKLDPDNPPDDVKRPLGKWLFTWSQAKNYAIQGEYPNHPAGGLPHATAHAYAQWQNGQLPTEAQWEFAAKSGDRDRSYVWSDETEPDGDRAHIDPTRTSTINTVARGSFPTDQTDQGLLDMLGSLREWCRDRYQPYRSGAERVENPDYSPEAQPVDQPDWVIRGGSFRYSENLRTTLPRRRQTQHDEPLEIGETGAIDIGFRIVIEVPRPPIKPRSSANE